ncbi:hypothetical protein HYH02_014514 [Chlamydomonas schloesseri]|uniref:LYR motif-containing protein 9 n=1 Tax=Chlamydomonas schloesseri TaxID=2026947 RepID=A0A835SIQ6_9CHLO|nr:hypothetical protein HYH02_014514 [Chlamydomonas schloesseri]|eukprot:KAG2427912.1 hypothetical protein HYH02_014514 [Chlamydomonas schloesseri]
MSSPLALYRELLRQAKTLPRDTQTYYRHHIRQHFNSHRDESDAERVQVMVARARQDALWILRKYGVGAGAAAASGASAPASK